MYRQMKFILKHYKKSASIQLKPEEDISMDPARCVHFSIAWFKNSQSDKLSNLSDLSDSQVIACNTSKQEQRAITAELFNSLSEVVKAKNNKLSFKIVKACENCTYGHFDKEFEEVVLSARDKYKCLCAEKNLPLHLHPEIPQDIPVIFHIAHSRSSNTTFNDFLKKNGETLSLEVSLLEVNK